MDKVSMKLLGDVLYCKGIICHEELEAIMNIATLEDCDKFVDDMLGEKFNAHKRGEKFVR